MPASSKMFLSAHSFRRIIVIDLVILPFDEASDRGRSIQVEKTIPLSQVKDSLIKSLELWKSCNAQCTQQRFLYLELDVVPALEVNQINP